jgi:hypothetical protein
MELLQPRWPLDHYDGVEVAPCREVGAGAQADVERCQPADASFWSVYLHLALGGVDCVGDMPTKDEALAAGRLCLGLIKRAGTLRHHTILEDWS